MIVHETLVHGRCPINGIWDYYLLRIRIDSDEFVRAEDIEEAADFVRGKPLSQEDMAKQIHQSLPACCSVEMRGRHGQNCGTTVILHNEPEPAFSTSENA